jgi:hypothetical protein
MTRTNEMRELTQGELETVAGGGSKTIQTEMKIGDFSILIAANKDGYKVCTYQGNSNVGHCKFTPA